eukprot:CAMPEP_0197686926 /NCGR_PEP_ID=MMETSP1338-20131121/103246_1 /TAXON_ID=43686 ORGANISM="Pelagodinium beii, Strain RCC1491" /NCGR_SAMPLE_ID=MMETSP1338 /ASSEMBLY_ACC=CAM_ASM_000754 /LENGTH=48 /DNA_ID= /DNA_START= /DNA_END= /DNA_ORIENTATION=
MLFYGSRLGLCKSGSAAGSLQVRGGQRCELAALGCYLGRFRQDAGTSD